MLAATRSSAAARAHPVTGVSYYSKWWHVHVASAFPLANYYRAVFSYG